MNTLDHLNGTRQRLRVAVEVLATHQGPLQRRLELAALTLAPIDPNRIANPKARARFEHIIRQVKADGSIPETCAHLGDATTELLAHRIIKLAFSALRTPRGGDLVRHRKGQYW